MASNTVPLDRFTIEASKLGSHVFLAHTVADAVDYIINLIRDKSIETVIKTNSAIAASLELDDRFSECGVRVTETSMVQWILQLAKGKEVPVGEVARMVSNAAGAKVEAEPAAILIAARRVLKEAYVNAGLGIQEADFGIADTGALVTLEDEGNVRLAAALPRIHLTLLLCENIVVDRSEVTEKIKGALPGIPGHKISATITYLTGRNPTRDIPGACFARARGPAEEHILLLDFPLPAKLCG